MQEQPQKKSILHAYERIEHIREQILSFQHACSGTVVTIRNTCGKPTCRCATDPSARHGPYYQWNRMKKGKLVHSSITEEQAVKIRQAIKNFRAILRLLRAWEEECAKIFDVKKRRKSL